MKKKDSCKTYCNFINQIKHKYQLPKEKTKQKNWGEETYTTAVFHNIKKNL